MKSHFLVGWKSIANFFGVSISSAKQWHCETKMPVYKVSRNKQGGVYALPAELSDWISARRLRQKKG